jgi:hypothetical protein
MPSSHFDEERGYRVADQALALRTRAGLTRRELAARLGVSYQAMGAWGALLGTSTGWRRRQFDQPDPILVGSANRLSHRQGQAGLATAGRLESFGQLRSCTALCGLC